MSFIAIDLNFILPGLIPFSYCALVLSAQGVAIVFRIGATLFNLLPGLGYLYLVYLYSWYLYQLWAYLYLFKVSNFNNCVPRSRNWMWCVNDLWPRV